jgi:putative endonuclease
MFYVYFLYSEKFDKYYVGHTDDPARRLSEHNHNENPTFTNKYRPWKLVWQFQVSARRGDALKIEKFIKRQKRRKLIERIIQEKFTIGNFKQVLRN